MIHTLSTDSQSFSPCFTLSRHDSHLVLYDSQRLFHTLSTLWFTKLLTMIHTLQYSFDEKIQKVSIILNNANFSNFSPKEYISPSRIEWCAWFVLKPSRTRVIWILKILLHIYYENPVMYVYSLQNYNVLLAKL